MLDQPGRSPAEALQDLECFRTDERGLNLLKQHLRFHHMPIAVLAPGRTTLADKYHALLHQFVLEAGVSHRSLKDFCDSIIVGTYDLGVEFSLSRVRSMPVAEMFSWVLPEQGPEPGLEQADDFAVPDHEEITVGLSHTLAAPGLLHIIHNAASDVLASSPLDSCIDGLTAVSKMLSDPGSCGRLMATCFSSPVGMQLREGIEKYSHKVYRPRWGTVAYALDDLLPLRRTLMWLWSKDRFLHAGGNLDDRRVTVSKELDLIDKCISSDEWWAKVMTLSALYDVVRDAFAWGEGCPCHSFFDPKLLDEETRMRWASCPMRGLRLPEVAAGDFFVMVRKLADQSSARLLVRLPKQLSAAARGSMLSSFERGRSFLIYTFGLKVSCYLSPPLLLLASSHHSRPVAQDAVRQCLRCSPTHPLLLELQQDPLKEQAILFCEGMELELLPELDMLVSKFHFAHSSERRVEGAHAFVQRRSCLARRRTEAWDSLSLRMKEIVDMMDSDSEFFSSLSVNISFARSPKLLVAHLGMQYHPCACDGENISAWDTRFRKCVYHADPATLFGDMLKTGIDPPPPGDDDDDFDGGEGADGAGGADCLRPALPAMPPEAGTILACLKRDTAMHFISLVISEHSSSRYMLSCRIPDGAVRTLTTLLVEDGCKAAGFAKNDFRLANELSVGNMFEVDARKKHLWFDLIAERPYKAKRGRHGSLAEHDWAIAVHSVVAVDSVEKPRTFVASTPINVARAQSEAGAMEQVPLVLSTSMFTYGELRSLHMWRCEPQAAFMWKSEAQLVENVYTFDWRASKLIGALVDAGSDSFQLLPGHSDEDEALLHEWHAQDLLEQSVNTAGSNSWKLSDTGEQQLVPCFMLADRKIVLKPRDIPVIDMTNFELMYHLEEQKWELKILNSSKEVKQARLQPYEVGKGPKIWYFRNGGEYANLSSNYMMALLSAAEHKRPVPHFAAEATYKQILDPNFVAPPPKPRAILAERDDEFAIHARRRKRARKPAGSARKRRMGRQVVRGLTHCQLRLRQLQQIVGFIFQQVFQFIRFIEHGGSIGSAAGARHAMRRSSGRESRYRRGVQC